MSFLSTIGVFRMSPKTTARLTRDSQKLWLSGIAFSLVHGAYQLQTLRERESSAKTTEAEGKLETEKVRRERRAVETQLILDGCDFLVPASGLGYLGVDEGIVGIAGIVSSIIGLKQAWAKAA